MKIFSDENSSRLSRHPARWPSFRDSKISAFGNSSPSRPWISDSLTGNRKRKGKLSKGIGYAKETASLTRFSTREWIRLRWDEIRPGKTFRFRIPRASTRTKCSLLRHKVNDNLSPPRFGTYGLKYAGRISRDWSSVTRKEACQMAWRMRARNFGTPLMTRFDTNF